MKKMQLTKNAMYCLSVIALVVVIAIVFKFSTKETPKQTKVVSKEVVDSVVVEDATLKVKLLDFVSSQESNEHYQDVTLTVDKNDKIQGYKISSKQIFHKIMQLLPPDQEAPLLNHSSEKPSHEAYVLILKGDIVKYRVNGKVKYRISNGYLTYQKQALVVESDYDSVYITSIDGKKEKMVRLDAYKKALNDIDNYMTMLQW